MLRLLLINRLLFCVVLMVDDMALLLDESSFLSELFVDVSSHERSFLLFFVNSLSGFM